MRTLINISHATFQKASRLKRNGPCTWRRSAPQVRKMANPDRPLGSRGDRAEPALVGYRANTPTEDFQSRK
ncbi:hypothetical protein GL4_0881 [Methyloceanibacter caenitepidi]|uniref:Uncharacterized protein n=1 Tax=Methyloceanibacter caenitepidi TaxID=1384459 RepID=A0A0A8K1H9_9HYPH|nr:hypothetical protein GL4_0881 [Methyloceanibacter caenitepidi]